MKKTSTRLATIGGTIILGAGAIVLAQHDSRNRDRDSLVPKTVAAKPAAPISVTPLSGKLSNDDLSVVPANYTATSEPSSGSFGGPTGPSIVRANNDGLPAYDEQFDEAPAGNENHSNPLRDGLVNPVVTASAEGEPSGSDGYPALPPPSLPGSAGSASSAGASPPPWMDNASTASLPSSGGLPGPDAFPESEALPGPDALPASGGLPSVVSLGQDGSAAGGSPLPSAGLPAPMSSAGSAGFAASLPAQSNPTAASQETPRTFNPASLPASGSLSAAPLAGANSAGNPASLPGQADVVRNNLTGQTGLPQNGGAPNGQRAYAGETAGTPYPSIPQAAGGSQGLPQQAPGGLPSAASNPIGFAQQTSPAYQSQTAPRQAVVGQEASGVQAIMVSDKPGNRYLDGSQTPNVTIEILPPGDETQVGKKATFVIMVSNRGNVDAIDVRVVDKVPQGTKFIDSEPAINPTAENLLEWRLGTVPAGEERSIRVNLIPIVEGEIGSIASVRFGTMASVRTLATQAKLELLIESLPEVLIGSPHRLTMQLKNSGTGVARNVTLEVDVPGNMSHSSGVATIAAELGDLHPNESRPISNLEFTAAQAGKAVCVVRALTADGVLAEKQVNVDVRAPQLTANIQGPRERYLQREAKYTLTVSNIGTATATNLDFAVHLPAGLRYIDSDIPLASYDRARHTVHVGLEELAAGGKAPFMISLMPVELGNQAFSLKASGDLGLTAQAESQVVVNGRAELEFSITQDNGSIEVGATTTYEVQILNKGDMPDRNVQLEIKLPEGARLVNISPQVRYREDGDMVTFEPIEEMPIRDSRTYRFEVQHNQSGTRLIRSRLTSENLKVGVLKEVPTFVYHDGE